MSRDDRLWIIEVKLLQRGLNGRATSLGHEGEDTAEAAKDDKAIINHNKIPSTGISDPDKYHGQRPPAIAFRSQNMRNGLIFTKC
ncbi:hypothetical protein [Pandoraea sputorum]|uniref:hypothetical protein n=1 Tax=Pandoraea sputorum TaxID=93222 RepID=UPI0017843850|nr:hypothetical protein [Pandoraea sputorum]